MTLRHDFSLRSEDKTCLDELGVSWETIVDGSMWILIHNFPTRHPGYNHETVTAAILLETGYPDTALDMVYFHPPLARIDGKAINTTDFTQHIDGKAYQRWSRHRAGDNPWIPGEDNLSTHLMMIEDWLEMEFEK